MRSYPSVLHNDTLTHRTAEEPALLQVHVEMSDAQLVENALIGDETAFEQIFDRHKRLVAIVASRYFRRPEQIEEIIQITFAKAFCELNGFRGLHDRSFSSWIARIAANACFDTLRSRQRKPETLACDLSDKETESLLELTADNSRAAEISLSNRDLAEKLLARISGSDRALLEMMYSEEMSIAEIAELLGVSQANVKVRAWRARHALRKVLRTIM
jgi:RNA polymerase sigma-70 factor (ECF subfamily)